MSRKAFTLIELLVVIAIIAILAAILFPVFAQAKDAAKKTQGLSNAKQIGTAMQIYVSDFDDTTPSPNYIPSNPSLPQGGTVDVYQLLQPYTKNMGIFWSPVWNEKRPGQCDNNNTPTGFFRPSAEDINRCVGYGYNWGFGIWAGGGLVGFERATPDGGSVLPGLSMTAVESPAGMAAFADTYNGRRYTMSAISSILQYYNGPRRVTSLRHGGNFNVTFVDGHAKSTPSAAWTYNPATPTVGEGAIWMPANRNVWREFWCVQEAYTVKPSNLPGLPLPDMGCGQFIDLVMSGGVLPLTQWTR
jgi:prepilin-type N-terminal cleavage/methylation domain-containing protein/prepilin-type processing-associated H-X9-DG protein